MTYWILLLYHAATVLLMLSSCETADNSRPLIIALPIRLQATRVPYPRSPEDREPEDSEEEHFREQRIIPRTFNPYPEPRYPTQHQPQQQQQEENNSKQYNSPPDTFLTWNPGNKFMVLQISDFIGGRSEDSAEAVSEENERTPEEPPMSLGPPPPILTKPGQHWAYQGSFDFEDSSKFPFPPVKQQEEGRYNSRLPPSLSSGGSTKKKKKKKNVALQNHSIEDADGDSVYGTDPVLHFLRNSNSRRKKNEKQFDFGEFPPEEEDDIGSWWKYQ